MNEKDHDRFTQLELRVRELELTQLTPAMLLKWVGSFIGLIEIVLHILLQLKGVHIG
jgi:hypothetical protein